MGGVSAAGLGDVSAGAVDGWAGALSGSVGGGPNGLGLVKVRSSCAGCSSSWGGPKGLGLRIGDMGGAASSGSSGIMIGVCLCGVLGR